MKKDGFPLILAILDGWGIGPERDDNAIARARKPNMDFFLQKYPNTILATSGEDVGLPGGQMGNSEVGHLNIGAGRIVYQDFTRISKAIRDTSFFANNKLLDAVNYAKEHNSALHLMGLLSDGGVHSHISHLFALLELARRNGLKNVYVHCFLDGRDTPPASALIYIKELEEKLDGLGFGKIATVMGRYYAMDRDRRWERVKRAYDALVLGIGLPVVSAGEAVTESYARHETDEFVQPTVIVNEDNEPVARVEDQDAVIFYNFRPDRAREISRAFIDEDFNGFERLPQRPRVHFTCLTRYDATIKAPVAFEPQNFKNTLGEVLSKCGLRQLRLAETEKYAHVTFFFNGGVEAPNPGEDRLLIPSPKVATYDLKPEMSAPEVTEAFLEKLAADEYEVIIMNYANADMVGHTGNLEAAVKAVEAVDQGIGKVVKGVLEKQGVVLITADHGNAEEMMDGEGNPHTAHTNNPTPFIFISEGFCPADLRQGRLEDIAPTILKILDIAQPPEMTGTPLFTGSFVR